MAEALEAASFDEAATALRRAHRRGADVNPVPFYGGVLGRKLPKEVVAVMKSLPPVPTPAGAPEWWDALVARDEPGALVLIECAPFNVT